MIMKTIVLLCCVVLKIEPSVFILIYILSLFNIFYFETGSTKSLSYPVCVQT